MKTIKHCKMNAPFKLRPYQQGRVDARLRHFRKSDESAVMVLPTGAGKSLAIAELARIARRRNGFFVYEGSYRKANER